MAKSDRILSFFPAFYRATERTKLLHEVVRLLALPLEEADTHLFRIQRAHRLQVAEQAEDIIRLAAVLNLTAFHFEDILADGTLDYNQKLALMRERVQRIARVHLQGLGTPWAVLESTAIFLNAAIVPDRPGGPLIKPIDSQSFSHKATIEFSHLAEKPRSQIYLHENPFRRQKIEPVERWSMNSWAMENKSIEDITPVKFAIQGVGERTVLPSLYCPDTGEGILFNGIVPEGKILVVDEVSGATIEGKSVAEWLIYFQGGAFDASRFDSSSLVRERVNSSIPFDGNLENLISHPFSQKKTFPTARSGRSQWDFKVAEGVYDGSDFDYSVQATTPEPIGIYDGDFNFDGCVFDFPASGVIGMAWDERIPCSFKILLPPKLPPSPDRAPGTTASSAGQSQSPGQPINYVGRLGSILPRFKAAGIRAFVDTAKDTWILGQSVIRGSTAIGGEGIEFHATRLQAPKTDLFVPLDKRS
jgi:hypothetical protein